MQFLLNKILKFSTISLFRHLSLISLITLLAGCASYVEKYAKSERDWEQSPTPEGKTLAHRVYLVGDAGNAAEGKTPVVLSHLKQVLKDESKESSVVFLGDNLYPDGLPPKSGAGRELAEHRLSVQAAAVKDFDGNILFVPGNHDWYKYGIDGLKRQRKFLRKELDRKKIWEPDIGCGGPEVVEVNDNLVFIVIDSQWWLSNWKKQPGVNEGCAATNRTDFLFLLKNAIKSNKEKNMVIVMHHPMETYGPHGGYFSATEHLFPFRKVNKNLWVPLPIIGSIYPFARANLGSRQDVITPSFQDLKAAILNDVQLNGNATFVSGHEHSLQYIEKDNQRYIVSGSGSKSKQVGMGEGSQFAYGGYGYSVLDLYEDGSLWVSFWSVDKKGGNAQLLFRKEIQAPPALDNYEAPSSYPDYPITKDVENRKLIGQDYNRGGFGRMVLGDHYRNSFAQDIDIPVLDLSTYKGGLTPVKKGGGNQTKSIRLEAPDGRQYSMRSLEKDPSATIGYQLSRSKLIRGVVEDAFTAAHPLSALPVVGLAAAAGVNHTNPEVYYIPSQPALGKYNPQFGGKVYLVEERPDDDLWKDADHFDNAKDIISTPDVLENMRKRHKRLLDVPAMARARSFDLLLGDWDRHDDQWRWVVKKKDGFQHYSPVPRDRDQAFSNYDGLVLGIARLLVPDTRPLAPFSAYPKKIHWATHGNRFFDATFLSEVSWDIWKKEVQHIQAQVTDEVIEEAFRSTWPTEIMAADGEKIIRILKLRRDNLLKIARDLYEFRARQVDVIGTDQKDHFRIDIQANGDVMVQRYDADKKGKKEGRVLYQRHFLASETKEIVLYGLDDDDAFVFTGKQRSKIKVRMVGGPGKDQVDNADDSNPPNRNKAYYYDYVEEEEKSDFNEVRGLKDRRSIDTKYNTFSRLSLDRNYNFFSLLPLISANPDNGLLLGASAAATNYGFKKMPFANRHTFTGLFASSTNGVKVDYRGEFTDVFGSNELVVDAQFYGSLYGANFYGFGNETINTEDENGIDYHRVRRQTILFSPQFSRRVNSASTYFIGPSYSSIATERTEGRFLADNSEDPAKTGIFSDYRYLGLHARLEFDNRNSAAMPTKGVQFHGEAGYNLSIDDNGANFPYLKTFLSFTQQLDKTGGIVVANRVGYARVFTDDFTYFQAVSLGGVGTESNFRGFRRERFSGQSAFYVNTDLRLRLLNSNNVSIPFSLGILGGFDVGRVWIPGEDSDTWHYSFGGGLWISPFDLASIKVSLFKGDGGKGRLLIGGAFFF